MKITIGKKVLRSYPRFMKSKDDIFLLTRRDHGISLLCGLYITTEEGLKPVNESFVLHNTFGVKYPVVMELNSQVGDVVYTAHVLFTDKDKGIVIKSDNPFMVPVGHDIDSWNMDDFLEIDSVYIPNP